MCVLRVRYSSRVSPPTAFPVSFHDPTIFAWWLKLSGSFVPRIFFVLFLRESEFFRGEVWIKWMMGIFYIWWDDRAGLIGLCLHLSSKRMVIGNWFFSFFFSSFLTATSTSAIVSFPVLFFDIVAFAAYGFWFFLNRQGVSYAHCRSFSVSGTFMSLQSLITPWMFGLLLRFGQPTHHCIACLSKRSWTVSRFLIEAILRLGPLAYFLLNAWLILEIWW